MGENISREDRRLEGGTAIEFEFQSASDDMTQVNNLKANVKQAAAEGAIVTQVQKQAAEKGVLTQGLKEMEAKVEVAPTIEEIKVEVLVPVRIEKTSTSPTPRPNQPVFPTSPPT